MKNVAKVKGDMVKGVLRGGKHVQIITSLTMYLG